MASWAEAQYVIDELKNDRVIIGDDYSGIPPRHVTKLEVEPDDKSNTISAYWPPKTIVEGQVICTPGKIRIVRKTGSYPQNENDGDKFWEATPTYNGDEVTGGSLGYPVFDTGLTNGTEYFYRCFVQSDHGVWNRDLSTIPSASGTPTETHIWGFDHDFRIANPSQCITYPSDVENANYKPMVSNKNLSSPTYGSWYNFLTKFLKNYPFMVKLNGEADYGICTSNYRYKKKNPTDYSSDWNAYLPSAASDYNNLNYSGGAFAWINKLYMKEEYEYASNGQSLSRKVRFSNKKLNGYKAIGFIDENGDELEGLWIPMGYTDNSGRVLVAGTHPSQSKTTAEQYTILNSKGFARPRFFGGPIINVLRDLEYMLFRNTNIQEQAGYGRCNVSATDHLDHVIDNDVVTDYLIFVGFYGTAASEQALNKMFHSQVLASYQCWLRDPYTILVNGQKYVSPYYVYNLSASGYKKVEGNAYTSTMSEVYMNKTRDQNMYDFGSDPAAPDTALGYIPTSSTGLCDAMWVNHQGTRIALRLGRGVYDGLAAGPSAIEISDASDYSSVWMSFSTLLLPPAGYTPFAD